jgi:serine protease inhibitor
LTRLQADWTGSGFAPGNLDTQSILNHPLPHQPSVAAKHINAWVEDQTRRRIRNLIPDGALKDITRLVLVNAIYLKAPWANEFSASATRPQTFYLGASNLIKVPTMTAQRSLLVSGPHD